jgi:NAD(P)-dependent dehydrogenase (short-subunit alcohol dehydrogenase family)
MQIKQPQAIYARRISHMARSIPFGSRSTADQVLAGIDLSRKRVLITGCNSGIGFETMKALSANGARIIGLARTLADAEVACSAVGRSLVPLGCDPTDIPSVDAAVESIRRLSDPLDAVIINSFELRCFADYIAQFVLVNRLAELVRHRTGRIVIGSDDSSMTDVPVGSVMFDNVSGERIYDSHAFHGQAKLTTALFTKELSRRLEARGVVVNAFHSGTTWNRNPREARHAGQRLIQSLVRYLTKSPAQRAATPALLAASPLVVGITGEYWSNCQMSRGNPLFSDRGLAKRLWDVSSQLAAITSGRGNSAQAASFGGSSLLTGTD